MLLWTSLCTEAYNLKSISSKDGLSNSSVLSFGQSHTQMMFFGTCDGVNIYDGTRIFPLPTIRGYNISGNIIEDIVFDRDDRGWILTNHGLSMVNRTESPVNMSCFQSARGLRLNAEGRPALLQDGLLYYHTGKDTIFVRLPLLNGDRDDDVRDFVVTDKYLYLFKNRGIVRYDLLHKASDYELGQRSVLSENVIQVAFCDDDRELLVDGDGGLWSFDFASGSMQFVISLKDDLSQRGSISSIRSLNGKLFVCFIANGVLMLQQQDRQYKKHDLGIQVGVTACFRDLSENIMWIGTDGQGVLMFLDEPEMRRSLTIGVLRLLQNKPFRAILADSDGTLWAGTKGDGLLEIPDFNLDNIRDNLQRRFWRREKSGLAGNSVFALLPSRKLHGFWIATNGGISFRSRTTQNIVTVPTEMPVEWVSALCERGDTLWMTTQGMGVYQAIIGGTDAQPRLSAMHHYVLDGGKKASNYFFSMASVPNGGPLYFGNRGKGLYVWQDGIMKWLKPVVETSDMSGLQDIFAILPTRDGLWVGTGSGLSFRPDGNEQGVEFYDTQRGMPSNVIHALAEDDAGNVWVSTNKGFVRFSAKSRTMRIYDSSDDFEVNEYADGAAFVKGDTVFFGGIGGISIIANSAMHPISRQAKSFEFTSMTINGKFVNINDYLNADGRDQKLTLNYDQNTLQLNFSVFDYFSPGNYIFYYSFSKNGPWIDNGASNSIALTRLSNGSHKLYVKYRNRTGGEEESEVHALHIYITPPWYISWWAKFLYLLLAIGVFYVLYRRWHRLKMIRTRMLHAQEEQARRDEIYEEKMHFLTNLVHELNTPLTLVYGPCERILGHQGTDDFVRKYVHMIQNNIGRLNKLIEEIIDFRRLNTGSEDMKLRRVAVDELVMDQFSAFKDMAEQNNITYECDIMKDMIWNTDERFMTRICSNLISNAFKYSKHGATIRVKLQKTDEGKLLFSVYNTGKGIAEKDRQRIFDYYSVLDNVDESDVMGLTSRNGLGMAICYNAVKQLGGSIDIDSVVDQYACFIVVLPPQDLPETAVEEQPQSVQENCNEETSECVSENTADTLPTETDVAETTASQAASPTRVRTPRTHRDGLPMVLAIDDNAEILDLLQDVLGNDYNILTAQSGEQGLDIIKQMMPDLIVTDIMMPGMNGLELTQQLKQNKHTMHIPLIILSARRSDSEQVEGLESGADAYVSKPFSSQYLLATVSRLLENRKVLKEYYNTSASVFTYQDGKLMTGEERQFRDQVVSVINKNLTNSDFTPDDLAREMNLSQRNLYRKFSESGLPTPKEFIKSYKIKYAARQLDTTNLTIQEIIYSSGFNTRSQFYTEFRKHYGVTPKDYREQHRVKDNSFE